MTRQPSRHIRPLTYLLSLAVCLFLLRASAVGQQDPAAKPRGHADAAKLKNPVAYTPDSVSTGKRIYQRTCLTCHGPTGKGDGGGAGAGSQPADLTSGAWQHGGSDGEIFTTIHDGLSADMQGFSDRLSDTDIWNLVNFIRSIGPKSAIPSEDSKQSKSAPSSH